MQAASWQNHPQQDTHAVSGSEAAKVVQLLHAGRVDLPVHKATAFIGGVPLQDALMGDHDQELAAFRGETFLGSEIRYCEKLVHFLGSEAAEGCLQLAELTEFVSFS